MEKFGYLLSEIPVLFLIIWFAVRFVQYRRYRNKQPIFSEKDVALLYPPTKFDLRSPMSRLRLARCILLATAAFYVEFLILAPLGAAILCASLMLTTAALVQNFILSPS
ncbi:MAG TPA: hypothetical protein VE170_05495 [Candidatus Limnocylindria bacterium]|nr:hypothetical protein [Candidatus Limnocylindria bacterium]